VRPSSRRSDDADVIRARLRALLEERHRSEGWLPDDLDETADDESTHDEHVHSGGPVASPRAATPGPVDDDPSPSSDFLAAGLPVGLGRHRAPRPTARWAPERSGARSLWIAALVAALLLVGWTWLERPRVEPAGGAPPSPAEPMPEASAPTVGEVADTPTTVVVSVVGQVAAPGLVTLPTGSRVAEAIDAAGGLLPEADPASVNLAAVITDGQQVAVGVPAAGGIGTPVDPTGATGSGPLDLNTAGVAELDALPGIGPVLAQRIVDHRTREGPFRSVEQLDDVPGIGPAIAAELDGLVTV
jgi:competence protein ComEA